MWQAAFFAAFSFIAPLPRSLCAHLVRKEHKISKAAQDNLRDATSANEHAELVTKENTATDLRFTRRQLDTIRWFGGDKKRNTATKDNIDADSIDSISFVPSSTQIDDLIAHSKRVEQLRQQVLAEVSSNQSTIKEALSAFRWEQLKTEGYCSGGTGQYQYWSTTRDDTPEKCKAHCETYGKACVGITFSPASHGVFGRAHDCRVHVSTTHDSSTRDTVKPPPDAHFSKGDSGGSIRSVRKARGVHCYTAMQAGPLLSKLYLDPTLVPPSLNPDETILAKLGRQVYESPDFAHPNTNGIIGSTSNMTIINDRKMPFGSTSHGPNGVLIFNNGGEFGKADAPRINLFYEDRLETFKLLEDYLKYRNDHKEELLDMFVAKLTKHDAGGESAFETGARKLELLDRGFWDDYTNVASMFRKAAHAIHQTNKSSIHDFGLGIISFCQTWLRNKPGQLSGHAQFDVMSPHFQTRFYVANSKKLKKEASVSQRELDSYEKTIKRFTKLMEKDYGGDDGQAFVNLDLLYDKMKAERGHVADQARAKTMKRTDTESVILGAEQDRLK